MNILSSQNLPGFFWFAQGLVFGLSDCAPAGAPVHLPEGVTIDRVTVVGVDDTPTDGLSVTLSRCFSFGEDCSEMARIHTDSDSSQIDLWEDTTIADAVVRNGLYQYGLRTIGCYYVQLRSVFIHYTP